MTENLHITRRYTLYSGVGFLPSKTGPSYNCIQSSPRSAKTINITNVKVTS